MNKWAHCNVYKKKNLSVVYVFSWIFLIIEVHFPLRRDNIPFLALVLRFCHPFYWAKSLRSLEQCDRPWKSIGWLKCYRNDFWWISRGLVMLIIRLGSKLHLRDVYSLKKFDIHHVANSYKDECLFMSQQISILSKDY